MTRLLLTALSVTAISTAVLNGQQPAAPAQQQAMIQRTQPAAEHRELAALAGRWTQEVTYRMGGGQTMKATGTAVNRMVLGGRFLISESKSSVPPGAPAGVDAIESMRIYGFDRRTNQFTIIELDSMGTYWVSAAGTKREPSTMVMSGESLDDHGGAREKRQFDMTLRVIDADAYVTETIFKFPGRPDLKIVEILHRRAQ